MECARLRTGDVDFHHKSVRVWHGKGGRHRVVRLAEELIQPLKLQIAEVQKVLAVDLKHSDYGGVWMPGALAKKYPAVKSDLNWQ